MQSDSRCLRVTSRATLTDNNGSERFKRGAVVTQYQDVCVMQSDRRCPRVTSRATLTDKQQQWAHRARCCRHTISGRLRHAERPSVSTRRIMCDTHRPNSSITLAQRRAVSTRSDCSVHETAGVLRYSEPITT